MGNRCINCKHLGVTCNGPNFLSMSAEQVLTWCKARKNYLHLTNVKLSELSGIPKGTIDRLLAGDQFDFRFESVRPLIQVLIGGELTAVCCHDDQESEYKRESQEQIIDLLEHENDRLQRSIDTIRNHHVQETGITRADNLNNISHLTSRIRDLRILLIVIGSLLFVCVVLMIIAFVIDRIQPDVGFIWRK